MTSLFNPFCPLFTSEIPFSVNCLIILSLSMSMILMGIMSVILPSSSFSKMSNVLFPISTYFILGQVVCFLFISTLNLLSMISYSYPATTTLSLNLATAFTMWLTSILIWIEKPANLAGLLPSNSPIYLTPFLSMVELVSISVRPITLCFRLLANMSAGHILLALICKLSKGLWLLGVLFSVLELMVCLVQAFVFTMLVGVYLEEGLSH